MQRQELLLPPAQKRWPEPVAALPHELVLAAALQLAAPPPAA
jgi:hypothetical protein